MRHVDYIVGSKLLPVARGLSRFTEFGLRHPAPANSAPSEAADRAVDISSVDLSAPYSGSSQTLPIAVALLEPSLSEVTASGTTDTSDSWLAGVSGDWNTAINWSGAYVPNASTDVTISASGSYVVSVGPGVISANTILLDSAGAELDLTSSGGNPSLLQLGSTFDMNAGTIALGYGSTIEGGTINVAKGFTFLGDNAELYNTAIDGTFALGSSQSLNIENLTGFAGYNGVGTGVIDIGSGSYIQFYSSSVNDGTINLGGAAESTLIGGAAFGSSLTINQTGEFATISPGSYRDDNLINDGTINADYSGGLFTIDTRTFVNGSVFINNGTFRVGNADTLLFNGYFSVGDLQTLLAATTNSGGTIAINGRISNGVLAGNYTLANCLLSGISYQGTLNCNSGILGAGPIVDLSKSDTFSGIGGVGAATLDFAGGSLKCRASYTLANVILDFGSASTGGTLINAGSGREARPGLLTIAGDTTINQVGEGLVSLTSGNVKGDGITNDGTINTYAGGDATIAIDVFNFTNSGTINLFAKDTLLFDGTYTGDAATELAGSVENQGGSFELTGAIAGGTLVGNFESSKVTLNSVTLNGLLTGIGPTVLEGDVVVAIDAKLLVSAGTTTYTFGNLSNAGTIEAAGGKVILQSLVTNNGMLLANDGSIINISDGTLSNLNGTTLIGGTLRANTGSTIEISNNTSIVTDQGNITLSGAGARIEALDTATDKMVLLESTLSTVAAGGTLSVVSGRNFTAAADAGSFTNSGTLILQAVDFNARSLVNTASGTLSGYAIVQGSVVNAGQILASKGELSFIGTISNAGTIIASGETVSCSGAVTGAGNMIVGDAGTLTLLQSVGSLQTVDFQTGGALLDLGAPLQFGAEIAGFGAGSAIDLLGTTATSLSYANNILTVENGTQAVAALAFQGTYESNDFTLTADGAGGSLIKFV